MHIKKFKSTRLVERYDEYNRLLGSFTMRMIVNSLIVTGDEITPVGFYYYINTAGETITIAPIKNTSFPRSMVEQGEIQLPTFTNNRIFEAMEQRTIEFALIKWQIENGSSFGLLANEWVIDDEED